MTLKFSICFNKFLCVAVVLLILAGGNLFAARTGKISGQVTDAKTHEPLLGVNVIIEGTSMGSSTDTDGQYYILGVPPGDYTMRASYIGYSEVVKTNVRVDIDRTTSEPFVMYQTSLAFGDSIVVSGRSVISLDVSSSKRDIYIEDIDKISVSDFNNILNLQPGTIFQVVYSNTKEEVSSELSIRGGTGVGIFVDGMNVSEAIISGSTTNFNLSALQASEILTGGFNAEYGNIRSGIINVVTKEGGSKYNFSLDCKVSSVGRKHFGKSIYDQSSAPEWLLYGGDDALYGEDGVHADGFDDSYWEKWSSFHAADSSYFLTPEQAQEVWKYQHRYREYGHKPDYIIDASFGGPLLIKGLSFFNSVRYEYNMFAVPLSRDHFEDLNWFWKTTYKPTSAIKINFQGNYQQNLSTTTYNTSHVSVATPEQAIWSMQYPLTKYYDAMRSIADRYRNQYGLSLTHILSPKTYYDMKLSYNLRRSFVNHAAPRDTADVFFIGGYGFDSAGRGGWVIDDVVDDFGGDEYELGMSTSGFDFILGGHGKERDFSTEGVTNFRFDFISQVTYNHQIKIGTEVNYDKMHLETGLIQYIPPLTKMNTFDRQPLSISSYVQDKIEFRNMIANVGVRFDYTDRSGTYYTDPYSVFYKVDTLEAAPTANIKPYFLVSPRVGISHPISDRSKLFFNYGHFYDEPKVEYLYIIRERENGYYDYIPNGNLRPQKTIAYELGFDQQIGRAYLLHISGFYRDITDEIKNVTYINEWGVNFRSYNNDLYEDVRGVELLFEKKVGDYFIGSLSYDYLVSSAGYVGNSTVYENTEQTPIETGHVQYTNIKYNFLANITFRTPSDFTRSELFNSWNLNFTHEHRSGPYMTYNPEGLPGVVNNLQWRPHLNTNMRLSKALSFANITADVYFEVYNLFNRKELTPYMRSYLLPQQSLYWDYIYSLDIDGGDRPGDYRKDYIILPPQDKFTTQLLFINPRRFFVGIHINF